MAPWNRKKPDTPRAGRAIRASSARKNLDNPRADAATKVKRQDWQIEAWEYFDDLGEIKYPTWWAGNAMSKLRLFCAVRPIDDPTGPPIPVDDPGSGIPPALASRAMAELGRLKSPTGGQSEILRNMNMNLEIAAQCWLVGIGPTSTTREDPNNPGQMLEEVTVETWDVRSILAVEEGTDKTIIHRTPGDPGYTIDKAKDELISIYQQSPGWAGLADSTMRGVLTDCQALVLLKNEVLAESKSRAGAGILTLPNELSPGPRSGPEDGDEATRDPFMDALADSMIEPIEDPSAAASVVPLLLRGQAEFLKPDVLRHISFSRDNSAVLEDRIKGRVESIARGLNLPMEVSTGHDATTFANAAQIDADTFDDHLQPRCVLIVDALTQSFLQPHLLDAGFDIGLVEQIIVWFDPVDLIKRVDPAESADKGIELDMLSGEAWRAKRGWTEDDAPEPIERLIRAALKGVRDPGLVNAIIEELDPALDVPDPAPAGNPFAASAFTAALLQVADRARAAGAPLLASRAVGAVAKKNPGVKLAAIDRELRTRTLIAANQAMGRALERAGSRLKSKHSRNTTLRTIHPMYAAQHLGPALVASAGFSDEDLIGDDAFDGVCAQFDRWTAHAQDQALAIAAGVVALSVSEKQHLRAQQDAHRSSAGVWLKAALLVLATQRLYAPDELPTQGEFDPTLKVPPGLVREAIALAGGAQGVEEKSGEWVAEVNGQPPGQIGTGPTVADAMTGGGALVQGIEWDYGPGDRQHPFEPHEALDGVIFQSFGDDVLRANESEGWVGITGTSLFPGDHEGCQCEWVLVWVPPDEVSDDTEALSE